MSRLSYLAPVLWLLSACDVAAIPQAPNKIAQNQCTSDSDCAGGVCTDNKQNKQCRSRTGKLQAVLFEVTPPADGSSIAGVQFLKFVEDVEKVDDSGEHTLDLGLVAQVSGDVKVVGRDCVPHFDDNGKVLALADDKSLPATVSLIPNTRALGLYSPRTVVQSLLRDMTNWSFSTNVPPGQYDIYVEPKHQPDDTCPVPPQLVRDQEIRGGTSSLKIKLPEPTVFELHVAWPLADGALNGWLVDMLDPLTGRAISNRVQLALGSGGKTDYVARVSYFPVLEQVATAEKAEELVRLAPPNDVAAPTVLLARSALGLFSANAGTLSDFIALPSPVHVQGQVTAQSTPRSVASTVTLVAVKITGIDPGVLASFVRTKNVLADGQFEVDLLPGTYRVSAVPSAGLDPAGADSTDSRLAAVTQEWVVASSPDKQAGKVIELGQALPINGQTLDISGRSVATAIVEAVASLSAIKTDVLHESLGEATFVPRASSGSVDAEGYFALNADPGKFDITVRPSSGTGFGWLAMPSAPVGMAGLTVDLAVPFPVSYRGTVTVPGVGDIHGTVPGALVRSYVYTHQGEYTSDPAMADGVLQIGETRADEDGLFEALIPASLNAPPAASP